MPSTITIAEEHVDLQANKQRSTLRFVDLFAGLGGFHVGLSSLGFKCVWASELDQTLRDLYADNFCIKPEGDIRDVDVRQIPRHDILAAGFPCQPFSKAGNQQGILDTESGQLYAEIVKILQYHRPRYLLLENVANLPKHDGGNTWNLISTKITDLGYFLKTQVISPHAYGIPQKRDRFFVIGSRDPLEEFDWQIPDFEDEKLNIGTVLDKNPRQAVKISDSVSKCLDVWQEFLDQVPPDEKIPHPLWSMEFGATYPYRDTTPFKSKLDDLKILRGIHGKSLRSAKTWDSISKRLPSHARSSEDAFPNWKIGFIKKNREFYERHRSWLDSWIPKISNFPSSFQKLEWNATTETNRNIRDYIIQLRPSGVRVRRPHTSPSLVASTSSQVPIIGWEERFMTPRECAKLQSLQDLRHLPDSNTVSFRALGNAVNATVVAKIANALIGSNRFP